MSMAIESLPEPRRRPDDALWRYLARRLARDLPISIREEGRRAVVRSRAPRAELAVREPATYREALTGGSVGLGLTYAAGWWDADDLVQALRALCRRLGIPSPTRQRLESVAARLRPAHRSASEDKDRDRRAVRAHYDLGDDFFALFLDPTLTYSCAYFERPGMSLADASVAKLDRICKLAELKAGDEVLEIGSGWGSFALHAAERLGCSVTTTTVSLHQAEHVRKKVAEEGLESRISVLERDYRDLRGQFDKVISIEMIEAVGWRQLDAFFHGCAGLLRPGGILVIQAIVIDDRLYEWAKRRSDFIKEVIFPGSSIPSLGSLIASAARTGALRLVEQHDIGLHYAETLKRWRARLHEERAHVLALGFDESFFRLWDFYLAYCEAGFAERRISDVQLVFESPAAVRHRWTPWP